MFLARAGRVADSHLADKPRDVIRDETGELIRYIQQKSAEQDPERKVLNVCCFFKKKARPSYHVVPSGLAPEVAGGMP